MGVELVMQRETISNGVTKKLNGIFREWLSVTREDGAPPIIWGHCVVHFSEPEFSGNVLHTSGVLRVIEFDSFKIVETRNNFYALLGPELVPPADDTANPMAYVLDQCLRKRTNDACASAAMNAEPDCSKCGGKGVYQLDSRHLAICDSCCKHNQGWWLLEGAYGADNGRWACKAGCGKIVDNPPPELEFLPRALI
jgi:hypothetical protein